MQQAHLEVKVSAHNLTEGRTYDMAAVRIRALDENGNVLGFFNEPVQFEVKGVLELIGPDHMFTGRYGRYLCKDDRTGRRRDFDN